MLLDIQKITDRLEQAGVPPTQARVHAAVLGEVVGMLEASHYHRFAGPEETDQGLGLLASDHYRLEEQATMVEAQRHMTKESLGAQIRAGQELLAAKIGQTSADIKRELIWWIGLMGVLQIAFIVALALRLVQG